MKKRIVFIFVAFILTLSGLGYFISQVKKEVLIDIEFQNRVSDLRLKNRMISEFLLKPCYSYELSSISKEELAIKKIIEGVKDSIQNYSFLEDKKMQLSFSYIERLFKKKHSIIERFKTYSVILDNSFLNASTLKAGFSPINVDKDTLVLIADIFSRISRFQPFMSDDGELNKLIIKLEYAKKDNFQIAEFIKSVRSVATYGKRIREVVEEDGALKIDDSIQEFLDLVNKNFEFVAKSANFIVDFIILSSFVLSYLLWILYKKQIVQKTELASFKKTIQNSDNLIMTVSPDLEVSYINNRLKSTFNYEMKDCTALYTDLINTKSLENLKTALQNALDLKRAYSGEYVRKNTSFYFRVNVIPAIAGDVVESLTVIMLDISEDKHYQKQIELKNMEISKRYYIDDITGLPNRNSLVNEFTKNGTGTFIILKIDSFDELKFFYDINNINQILKEIADLLDDIANVLSIEHIYNLGLGEFAFLTRKDKIINSPFGSIEYIMQRIYSNLFRISTQELHLNVTAGVSYTKVANKSNPNELLLHGELAHRYAHQHKLPYAIFNPEDKMEDYYKNNLIWTQKISQALSENRIVVFYQPIFDALGNIIYYEVLVRLIEKDNSVVSPYFFLDIAKKSNQYIQITKKVIEQAFDTFKDNNLSFSINLGFEDIDNDSVRELLRERLQVFERPERFTVEILESVSAINYKKVKEFIAELKQYGCKIAIDDFGSGYSNFERVLNFDVDYIKIDGSLIKNIDKDENMRKIAESVVHFAKNINKKIVAEFVSNEAVFNESKRLGVDYFQGHYFREASPNL